MNAQAPIPIKNLYYLFCYAWNHFQEGKIVPIEGIESPDIADLLARVLIGGTHRLFRRGADRGYVAVKDDSPYVRGRIILEETVKRNLTVRAQAHCEFDELTYDVLHNQILKATILELSKTEPLDRGLRQELKTLFRLLAEVTDIRLTRLNFRRLQLSRNNAYYDFLMRLCELVREALLPEENSGHFRFRDVLRDERLMARVFQNFVYNFYRLEQTGFKVSSDRICWDLDARRDAAFEEMLPSMVTDVSLRSKDRTILLDTKYYVQTFQNFRGSESIRSSHLYQIFAYLKNFEVRGGPDSRAEGLLLYPTVSKAADFEGQVQGHRLRVFTLDLSQEWPRIREDLLGLLRLPVGLGSNTVEQIGQP